MIIRIIILLARGIFDRYLLPFEILALVSRVLKKGIVQILYVHLVPKVFGWNSLHKVLRTAAKNCLYKL